MWHVVLPFIFVEGGLILLYAFLFQRFVREDLSQLQGRHIHLERMVQEKRVLFLEKERGNTTLEKQILDLIELYELAKKLFISLEFHEVFTTLFKILQTHFSFQTGYLFLLKEKEEHQSLVEQIDQIYGLKGSEKSPHEKEVILKMNPHDILYLREVMEEAQAHREAFQGKTFPFTAIPLWGKDQLIAILVCEYLHPEDAEKFIILSRQLALAIQKVDLYEKIQELAITDGLTRLYSRRYFLERLIEELERSKRHNLPLSFMMADIDHFKDKNDRFGHLVGDVILREVSDLLKENVREVDLIGRYGGEEFAIALPDTGIEEALRVAERIRKGIEEKPFSAYDQKTDLTLSIGIGSYPTDGESVVDLVEAADSALYHAKASGRNRIATRTSSSRKKPSEGSPS